MSQKPKIPKQEIIDFIKSQNPLENPTYYFRNNNSFYQSAQKYYRGWKSLVLEAGRDYNSCLKITNWSREKIHDILKQRVSLGRNINARHMYYYYSSMFNSIPRYFGSYASAVESIGIKYSKVNKLNIISKEDAMLRLLRYEQRKFFIHENAVRQYDIELLRSARQWFGSYSNFLKYCNINPKSVSPRNCRNDFEIINALNKYEFNSSYDLTKLGENSLVNSAINRFGSWSNAVAVLEFCRENSLFERLDDFKSIKSRREDNKLRQISLESRIMPDKKRFGKKCGRKIISEVNEKRKYLTNYLFYNANDFLTCKTITLETEINKEFLVDATPTDLICCITGENLISATEDRARNLKYRGTKAKINNALFYYHKNRWTDLKQYWAKNNLK